MKFGLACRRFVPVGYFWRDKISKQHSRGKQVVFLSSIKKSEQLMIEDATNKSNVSLALYVSHLTRHSNFIRFFFQLYTKIAEFHGACFKTKILNTLCRMTVHSMTMYFAVGWYTTTQGYLNLSNSGLKFKIPWLEVSSDGYVRNNYGECVVSDF